MPEPTDADLAEDVRPRGGTVVVVSGGAPLEAWHRDELADDVYVVAADSGIDRALEAGLRVDVAVGDFDSVTARGLAAVEAAGAEVRRFPTAKDRTDLELAIDVALAAEPDRLVFVAMHGGRVDHEFAGLLLLSDPRLAGVDVDALLPDARLVVVHDRRTITGRVGDLLSIVAVAGNCYGVRLTGVEYPLDGATVRVASGLGVSNVLSGPVAVLEVRTGVLYAFLPR